MDFLFGNYMKDLSEKTDNEILKAIEHFRNELKKIDKFSSETLDSSFKVKRRIGYLKAIESNLLRLLKSRKKGKHINIKVNKTFLFDDNETIQITTLKECKAYIKKLDKEIKTIKETADMLDMKYKILKGVCNIYSNKIIELKIEYEKRFFTNKEFNDLKGYINNKFNIAFNWVDFKSELKKALIKTESMKEDYKKVLYLMTKLKSIPEYNKSVDLRLDVTAKLLKKTKGSVRSLWNKYSEPLSKKNKQLPNNY